MINAEVMQRMGLLTLLGMGGLALIADFTTEKVDLAAAIIGHGPFWQQVFFGVITGLIAGKMATWIVGARFMTPVRLKYARIFKGLTLSTSQIWFVSYCAGVGEELLFRGAIQPFIGIPITSVLFVAIHGYLDPRNWRLMIYGIWMSLVIAWVGWMSDAFGLVSAIIAHMLIDVVILSSDSEDSSTSQA